MTIVEIKRAIENKNIGFGLKEVLKKGGEKIFISNDAREVTEKKLQEKGIEFFKLREDKEKISKELKLPFLSEVFVVGKKNSGNEKSKRKKEK